MHIWAHFKTITSHKLLVMRYCFKIGLYRQGLLHDLSKYSWTEFSVGCRYYQGNRSPNNAEREDTGLSTSWIHHYGRNKHHFEHWVDYGVDCDTVIQGCSHAQEIHCGDGHGPDQRFQVYNPGDLYGSGASGLFLKSRDRLWFVHEKTNEDLEFLLRMLAEKGEKETLRYIKKVYLKTTFRGESV